MKENVPRETIEQPNVEVDYSVDRSLCAKNFKEFVKEAFKILEPGTKFLDNWHIDLICEYLQLVTDGKITRLIINIPPRYMKSILVSVLWPCWEWIHKPQNRYLCASYSHTLSVKHSMDRRTILDSNWYKKCFWDKFVLSSDHNTKNEFSNTHRGYMGATSFGGSATGKGGNRILIDDPMNPKEAYSEVQRETANREFDQTFYTRLDDKEKGAIVIIMQRLHEKDLTGHLLSKGEDDYVHLVIPGIAEDDEDIKFPISGEIYHREIDSVLWAERESVDQVNKTKRSLGSYNFAGQYQQRPSPKEGGMIKKHWWRYYNELPERFDMIIQSWDLAFKDTKTSAFVVGQCWGTVGPKKYLIDQIREKLDFPNTIKAIRNFTLKHPKATAKLIEDKANGPAVIAVLSKHLSGIIPIEPDGSKEARVSAVSAGIEAGDCYLPTPELAPWIDDFVEECALFPNGAYADQVDTMSQALRRLEQYTNLDPEDIDVEGDISEKYDF